MLTQICAEIKNYFASDEDKHIGDFSIIDGQIAPPIDILDGQYYRIIGSVFNDGVHKYGDETDVLKDEPKFHGGIWLMRVPKEITDIATEIMEWESKNGDIKNTPYASESFAGYSYTLASGYSDGASGASWSNQKDFLNRLKPYRKLRA
mgnify:CR=1 FL=1